MSNWHKVEFQSEEFTEGTATALVEKFGDLFIGSGAPHDAALYSASSPSGTTYFFSPSAALLARELLAQYRTSICEPPAVSELSLIVGHSI